MEFIFTDRDGLKNIIFDYGNNIMLAQVTVGRQVQWVILAKDYASDMGFIKVRGIGFLVYITTDNQLVWQRLGDTERIILNTVLSEVLEIDNINIISLDNGIYVIYRMHNVSENKWELRYINPLGERRSRILVSVADKFLDYRVFNINEKTVLSYRLRGDKKSKYFAASLNEDKEIIVLPVGGEEQLNDLKIEKENMENEVAKYKNESVLLREKIEKVNTENRILKTEVSQNKAIEAKLEDYKNQYEELAKLTKDIQEEGKRWRELYYRSIGKK